MTQKISTSVEIENSKALEAARRAVKLEAPFHDKTFYSWKLVFMGRDDDVYLKITPAIAVDVLESADHVGLSVRIHKNSARKSTVIIDR